MKFGRPSRVVALTLPEDAINRLRRVHKDIGWAIVKLLDDTGSGSRPPHDEVQPDVELVRVAARRSLIVVNHEAIAALPGVNIIPLGANRSFLALDIDRNMSDLELAVNDRLADLAMGGKEHRALRALQMQLRRWRHDRALRFQTRAIIVVEHADTNPPDRDTAATRAPGATRLARSKSGARELHAHRIVVR